MGDADDPGKVGLEHSRSGAPATGAVLRDRFTADEIYQRIVVAADLEFTSRPRELFFSGFAAGFAMTLTFLLYASVTAATGGAPLASAVLYPLGFVFIILGRYQLYTENTLPPVTLAVERLASIPNLLRVWGLVLAGNVAGAANGAAILALTDVFPPEAAAAAVDIGREGLATPWSALFFKASYAGLIVAGVVWLDYSARDSITRFLVVYVGFLAIPLGNLFHVVVSFTELFYLTLLGEVALSTGFLEFVLPVLLGNTAGGVLLVTLVNYFRTTENRLRIARFQGPERQLSLTEWLFGPFVGRGYVPVLNRDQE